MSRTTFCLAVNVHDECFRMTSKPHFGMLEVPFSMQRVTRRSRHGDRAFMSSGRQHPDLHKSFMLWPLQRRSKELGVHPLTPCSVDGCAELRLAHQHIEAEGPPKAHTHGPHGLNLREAWRMALEVGSTQASAMTLAPGGYDAPHGNVEGLHVPQPSRFRSRSIDIHAFIYILIDHCHALSSI